MTSTPAWISLGSNLGDRRAILDAAVAALGRTPGVAVAAVSSFRETQPVGGPPGQGLFLNAAARLDTTLGPRELLHALQAIEADLGRVRTVRWGERSLDLDILIFGDRIIEEPDLIIPHPRYSTRRFVLGPLAQIGPAVVDPRTGLKVIALLANLDRPNRHLAVDSSIWTLVPDFEQRLQMLLAAESLGHWRVAASDWAHLCDLWRKLDDSTGDALGRSWLLSVHRPTLWVAAPPRRIALQSSYVPVPVYRPAAIEPDAIVAEVVAVCRGIEAV